MLEHSPEPWKPWRCEFHLGADTPPDELDFCGFEAADGTILDYSADLEECRNAVRKVDGRRILACVNALAGVPDGLLEAAGEVIREMLERPLPVSTLTADEAHKR